MDQVNVLLRGFDPGLRFLLEGVDDPDVIVDLQGIDRPGTHRRDAGAPTPSPLTRSRLEAWHSLVLGHPPGW